MNKKNIYLIINLIIFFSIVLLTMNISRYSSLASDDISWAMLLKDENIFDLLFKNAGKIHGGGYTNLFLTKLFCWKLPEIFHIHPNNFIVFPMGMIKGIILAFLCYFISKFVNIFSRSRTMQCLLFLTSASIFFFLYCPQDIHNYALTFFRYPFSILIFAIFWYFTFKNIMYKSSNNIIKCICISLCAIILGSNLEICIFTSLFLSVLIILYNCIAKIYKANKAIKLFNLNYCFFIPVFILFISSAFFLNSEGFRWIAEERGLNNINITFSCFTEFTKLFIKYYFIKNWIYIVSFIALLCVGISINRNKHDYRGILLAAFMQISLFSVIFSLILCEKTLYELGKYWIEYDSVIFTYQVMSYISIVLLIGFVVRLKKYSKTIRNIYFIILFLLLFISAFLIFNINKLQKIILDEKKELRKINYICDKINHFYYLKNEIPVLPQERKLLFPNLEKCLYILAEYNKTVYNEKIEDVSNYKVIFDDDAINKFNENGGIFSDEELVNMDFSQLWNDEFILNKNKN